MAPVIPSQTSNTVSRIQALAQGHWTRRGSSEPRLLTTETTVLPSLSLGLVLKQSVSSFHFLSSSHTATVDCTRLFAGLSTHCSELTGTALPNRNGTRVIYFKACNQSGLVEQPVSLATWGMEERRFQVQDQPWQLREGMELTRVLALHA